MSTDSFHRSKFHWYVHGKWIPSQLVQWLECHRVWDTEECRRSFWSGRRSFDATTRDWDAGPRWTTSFGSIHPTLLRLVSRPTTSMRWRGARPSEISSTTRWQGWATYCPMLRRSFYGSYSNAEQMKDGMSTMRTRISSWREECGWSRPRRSTHSRWRSMGPTGMTTSWFYYLNWFLKYLQWYPTDKDDCLGRRSQSGRTARESLYRRTRSHYATMESIFSVRRNRDHWARKRTTRRFESTMNNTFWHSYRDQRRWHWSRRYVRVHGRARVAYVHQDRARIQWWNRLHLQWLNISHPETNTPMHRRRETIHPQTLVSLAILTQRSPPK